MAIYNKYVGLPWESESSTLIIGTATDISFQFTNNLVLENLEDNVDGYIIPKYLRNMFISTWDSTAFKTTTASGSNIEYIGIDSGIGDDLLEKPNRDLVGNKIFLGKKSYSGTFSYSESYDIMTSNLLSSDIDLFFYNTKSDDVSQYNTRLVLLAGTDQTIYSVAPYIQSQLTTTPGGSYSLSLDFVNNSGDIILLSQGQDTFGNNISNGGNVNINDIIFPTIGTSSMFETQYGVDKMNLVYRDGELVWDKISLPQTDYIGVTGSRLSINGTPINANSHTLDFTDDRPCPIKIGDISLGSTFDRMSIADVLRKIIYPYLPPTCTISLANSTGYVEIGTYPNISINYSITKKTENTLPTRLVNMLPSSYPKITTPGENTISGVSRGVMIQPITATTSLFSVVVSDGISTNTATTSVSGVYPYFYGFTYSNSLTTLALSSMNKLVEPKGDKTYDLVGSGNFFFAYDADYGPLTSIYDDLNINIIGSFSSSIQILSSPTGLWTSKEYIVYKWENVSQIGPPSENFQFEY